MTVLNLTQHPASPEQRAAGVVDLEGDELEALHALLTFEELPDAREIHERAANVARLATMASRDDVDIIATEAMIGGAPYLMSALEAELLDVYIEPVYAFSRRESVEEVQPDGSVRKVNVFRHAGFVRTREA